MPVVPYYQGRPACTWVKIMSRPVRAGAVGPSRRRIPATRQPATTAAQQRAQAGTNSHSVRQRLASLGSQLVHARQPG